MTGDIVFTRGIQEGVKRGEYIYKYRDLLCGPNDPAVHITIDEDAFVYTMSFAKDHAIWPPIPVAPVVPKPATTFGGGGATLPFIAPTGSPSVPEISVPGADGHALPSGGKSARSFTKEGPLRQALTQLIEEARFAQVPSLSSLTVRLTELLDASRMLLVSGGAPGATARVTLEGHYATEGEGEFTFEFRGSIDDALPVKDFLGPTVPRFHRKRMHRYLHPQLRARAYAGRRRTREADRKADAAGSGRGVRHGIGGGPLNGSEFKNSSSSAGGNAFLGPAV